MCTCCSPCPNRDLTFSPSPKRSAGTSVGGINECKHNVGAHDIGLKGRTPCELLDCAVSETAPVSWWWKGWRLELSHPRPPPTYHLYGHPLTPLRSPAFSQLQTQHRQNVNHFPWACGNGPERIKLPHLDITHHHPTPPGLVVNLSSCDLLRRLHTIEPKPIVQGGSSRHSSGSQPRESEVNEPHDEDSERDKGES